MEVFVIDKQEVALNKELIRELCTFVLQQEKAPENAEVNISLMSTKEIAQLNKRYSHVGKPTDVLSFSLKEEPPVNNLLGDIAICPEEAGKKAIERQTDFNRYLGLLVVHATLHLLDYSHKTAKDAKVMSGKEESLLRQFNSQRFHYESKKKHHR